jgi:hypothetical protein
VAGGEVSPRVANHLLGKRPSNEFGV